MTTLDLAPRPEPAPARAPWWRVLGGAVVGVVLVVALEAAALLAPAPIGLGIVVATVTAAAIALRTRRAEPLRALLRLDGALPAPARLVPGALLVALFVLSALLLLREAAKTIDLPLLTQILGDRSAMNRLRLVSVIVVLGPLGEELALRGWLQRHLELRWGAMAAVPLTGLAFGLLHGVDARIAYFVTLGVMFGAAAIAFRSLWAPIALHMTVNAMGALPLLLGTPTAPPAEALLRAPSSWWGVAGVACVLLLFPVWLGRVRAGRPVPGPGMA
jgi:membrane protease YdiL (CAAX protease family)